HAHGADRKTPFDPHAGWLLSGDFRGPIAVILSTRLAACVDPRRGLLHRARCAASPGPTGRGHEAHERSAVATMRGRARAGFRLAMHQDSSIRGPTLRRRNARRRRLVDTSSAATLTLTRMWRCGDNTARRAPRAPGGPPPVALWCARARPTRDQPSTHSAAPEPVSSRAGDDRLRRDARTRQCLGRRDDLAN